MNPGVPVGQPSCIFPSAEPLSLIPEGLGASWKAQGCQRHTSLLRRSWQLTSYLQGES